MNGGVADDGPLDYATIQIIPSENRYEAFVCCSNEVDALTDGILNSLLPHLPEISDLNAKGSNATLKLQLPEASSSTTWFTKSTLRRFLQIVGSPDLANVMKTMNEMAQLEEAKKFHLALYGKDKRSTIQEKDGGNLDETSPKHKSGAEFASSAASKNELLRAMDLRLTALNRDLSAAFEKACGATYTSEEISHLSKISEHFGATNLKNCTCKYLELNQKTDTVDSVSDDKHVVTSHPSNESSITMNGSSKVEKLHSTPVKYGVSPAKVAQVERQDSSESEDSSDSSNEDGMPAERSRPMVRSALSRRSASPMRRIQVGRTGSRRVPALTIKSLNYLQTRENMSSQGDPAATSDDEEGSEPSSKKADNDSVRISVQAAISLFESKQRDETADFQKRRSLANATVAANKLVLRRWSTGMGEASTKSESESLSDKSHPSSHGLAEEDIPEITEGEAESNNVSLIDKTCITAEVDVKLDNSEIEASDPQEIQAGSNISQPQEDVQKLNANSEWNQRKQAELDQMLMEVMECKHKTQKNSQATKKKDVNSKNRSGLYDQYKAKRDEKRRVEESRVLANKESQNRGIRQTADDRRSKIASAEVNVKNKSSRSKSEISHTNLPKPEKPKKEMSKPSVLGKTSSRNPPVAATRKSWPSVPSERTIGMSPASTNQTQKKMQQTSSVNRLSAKTERTLVQKKNVKETTDSGKDSRRVNEKKPATEMKNVKTTKSKVMAPSGDSAVPVKSSIRDKVTKKSSIVPLESKSFHRSSRNSLDNSPVVSKKKISKSAKSLKNNKSLSSTHAQEIEVTVSDLVSLLDKGDALSPAVCDSETLVNNDQNNEKKTDQVNDDHEDLLQDVDKSPLEIAVEAESMIPSKSTEEIEEFQEIPAGNDDVASLENNAPSRSPRVRLSLSQMLQEENSEPDTNDWGIAENPPAINYQRDAPKGFKRLLKFGRKGKGEGSLAGWSSPSVVSEGEDDSEESKALNMKRADNLLMKATQNSGLVKASQDKKFDTEKLYSGAFGAQNFNPKFSHDSASVSTTKAARSFFSLSAFRGSKQNEPKLR